MSSFPGSPKLVKAGFVQLDPVTGTVLRILVFQYNPEMLARRLECMSTAPPGTVLAPREVVTFTLALDAADKLQAGDPATVQRGLLPDISALELLLYPVGGAFTVWVSGVRCVPVRVTELQISEEAFDPALNPIRAKVSVTLLVLKGADLVNNPRELALWDNHFIALQQLAKTAYEGGTLTAMGLSAI